MGNPNTSEPQRPRQQVLRACQTDDVSLITDVLSRASTDENVDAQELLSRAVSLSIRRKATRVLTYVLELGAEVPAYSHLYLEEYSQSIIKILLDHGWDINARQLGERPLLWEVVGDGDLVKFCLEHGATAAAKDLNLESEQERQRDESGCPPILEVAASQSTIVTFELLRSAGGQLGRRTLHMAAKAAVKADPDPENQMNIPDKDRAKFHSERLALVSHLIDQLGLDPNALDQPEGWMLGNHWGPPLCYVARSNPNWDCSDVTSLLVRKGAKPTVQAMELAERAGNFQFLSLIKDMKIEP